MADAHPLGARPFARDDYLAKFHTLAEGVVPMAERERFLDLATRVSELSPAEVALLTVSVSPRALGAHGAPRGVF